MACAGAGQAWVLMWAGGVRHRRAPGATPAGRARPPGTHLERCVNGPLPVQEKQAQREAHEAAARLREVCLAAQHEGLKRMERGGWEGL